MWAFQTYIACPKGGYFVRVALASIANVVLSFVPPLRPVTVTGAFRRVASSRPSLFAGSSRHPAQRRAGVASYPLVTGKGQNKFVGTNIFMSTPFY